MGMKESEKMFIKNRLEKPKKQKGVRKQIYNMEKVQKKINDRQFKEEDAHFSEAKKKQNLLNISNKSRKGQAGHKDSAKRGMVTLNGSKGNKTGVLISDSKQNNKIKLKEQNIIGSLKASMIKKEAKLNPRKISEIQYTNPLMEKTGLPLNEAQTKRKNLKKLKTKKMRKKSRSGHQFPLMQRKPADSGINASKATIFHYEFNINTFNNFMKSLKVMGFKEFDIEEYSQGASITSIPNYMDSPFPSKALPKQNSLVNLPRAPSGKKPGSRALYASFQNRQQANSFTSLSQEQTTKKENRLNFMQRSLSQKAGDFTAFQTKKKLKAPSSLKDKLKRNMSSNQLPTTLEPIPEQELYPKSLDIPLQLKKVSLMNKNTESLSKNWFSSLKSFDVKKFKDPKIDRFLVLDLDETLIHCSPKMLNKDAKQVSLFGRTIFIHLRPYVRAFLREMRRHFNLVIYTASKQAYADVVLKFLDPEDQLFCLRLYRTSCQRVVSNHVIKTMSILSGVDPRKTLIIDNSLICFFFDLEHAIPVLSYFGNVKDQELYLLCTFIVKELIEKQVPDFRTKLKDIFKLEMLKSGMEKNLILKSILSK